MPVLLDCYDILKWHLLPPGGESQYVFHLGPRRGRHFGLKKYKERKKMTVFFTSSTRHILYSGNRSDVLTTLINLHQASFKGKTCSIITVIQPKPLFRISTGQCSSVWTSPGSRTANTEKFCSGSIAFGKEALKTLTIIELRWGCSFTVVYSKCLPLAHSPILRFCFHKCCLSFEDILFLLSLD